MKSSALRVLALEDQWFSDSHLDFNYGIKDAYQAMRGVWLYEIAELEGITRAKEVATVKAFLSSSEDRYRPSYGRNVVTWKRQTVFCGTTNEDAFLRDETGSRRFWPIKVGEIDLEGLRGVCGQLWGEAVYWFRGGERWWLTEEMEAKRAAVALEYRNTDDWEAPVLEYARSRHAPFTSAEVITKGLDIEVGRISLWDQKRVARILRTHGFIRVRKQVAGSCSRAWRHPPVVSPVSSPDEEDDC